MPTTILTGTLTGVQNVVSQTTLYLLAGSRILNDIGNLSEGAGIRATGTVTNEVDLFIDGAVIADESAVDLFSMLGLTQSLNGSSVTVGETGVLRGRDGILMQDGVGNSVSNFGQISGLDTGIYASGGTNTGTFRINNAGTFQGLNGNAISTAATNNVLISNSGVLQSFTSSTNTAALLLQGFLTAQVVNSGQIISGNGTAIAVASATRAFSFLNTGTVDGSISVNAIGTVTNGGIIHGNVNFNGNEAADSYTALGDGVVTGLVQGGSGDDTLTGGSEADRLDGGDDNDRVAGMGGDDVLSGGTGEDTLRGGDGDDQLDGGSSGDRLAGNAGDDMLLGGGNADALFGGTGDDSLDGGTANDTLQGGDGDDVLIGGAGTDDMAGGAGADSFVFIAKADSGLGDLRDIIRDFTRGEDVIDLRAVAAGTLLFLAPGAPFAGTPAVRVTETASGNSILNIDTDGVGAQDMQITLLGVTGLTSDDFLL